MDAQTKAKDEAVSEKLNKDADSKLHEVEDKEDDAMTEEELAAKQKKREDSLVEKAAEDEAKKKAAKEEQKAEDAKAQKKHE